MLQGDPQTCPTPHRGSINDGAELPRRAEAVREDEKVRGSRGFHQDKERLEEKSSIKRAIF